MADAWDTAYMPAVDSSQPNYNSFDTFSDAGNQPAAPTPQFVPPSIQFGASGSGGASQNQLGRAAAIRDQLSNDLGISQAGAAGVVSNLMGESGPNIKGIQGTPASSGQRGPFGWAQWIGPRRTDFENWTQSQGLDPASDAANYGFMVHEIATKYPQMISNLQNATDPVAAAKYVFNAYIGGSDPRLAPSAGAHISHANAVFGYGQHGGPNWENQYQAAPSGQQPSTQSGPNWENQYQAAPSGQQPNAQAPQDQGFLANTWGSLKNFAGEAEQGAAGIIKGIGEAQDSITQKFALRVSDFGQYGAPLQQAGLIHNITPEQAHAASAVTTPIANAMAANARGYVPANPTGVEKVAGFAGGVVPIMGAGVIAGPAGMAGALGAGGYDEAYEAAKRAGQTDEQAQNSAWANAVPQAGIGLVPFGRPFEALAGKVARPLFHFAAETAAHSAGGAAMMGASRLAENTAASQTYNPDQPLFMGVPEAMAAGALVGGGMHVGGKVLGAAYRAARPNPTEPPSPESGMPDHPAAEAPLTEPMPATDAITRYRDDGRAVASKGLQERAEAAGAVVSPDAAHDDLLAATVEHEAAKGVPTHVEANTHEADVEQLLSPNDINALNHNAETGAIGQPEPLVGAGEVSAAGHIPPGSPEAAGERPANPEGGGAGTGAGAGAGEPALSQARLEPTPSGKGIVLTGASPEELAAIADALPKAQASPGKDGSLIYSAKHADAIRDALASVRPVMGAAEVAHQSGIGADLAVSAISHPSEEAADAANPMAAIPGAADIAAQTGEAAVPGAAEVAAAPPPPIKSPTWGAQNKGVTIDRAAEVRRLLQAKMNQLNSGIDPETLMLGSELAAFHIEAGARKFADFVKAMVDDLGQPFDKLRPFLRHWYNGARDELIDRDLPTKGMDSPEDMAAALKAYGEPSAPEPEAPALTGAAEIAQLPVNALRDRLLAGERFATILDVRKAISEITGEPIKAGTPEAKRADEMIEAAVVQVARHITASDMEPMDKYRALVDLYGRQPSLNVRSSTSIEQQAYSTPVPLAYLASQRAGIDRETTVYEPSAGNGALLIDADPAHVTANELNPARAEQLRDIYPHAKITEGDATIHTPESKVDVVIANPPFGAIKDADGESHVFHLGGGYNTREIDHAISLRALDAMKDNGRAVLIVGSIAKTIKGEKARGNAYNGKAKREFYYRLYSQYNVTDHFTVAGELYSRQGAGWPVDVIVIDGRGKSALKLPAVSAPRVYDSWTALEEEVAKRPTISAETGSGAGEVDLPIAQPEGSDGRAGSVSGAGGNNLQQQRPADEQPNGIRDGLAGGQPSGGGLAERETDQPSGAAAGAERDALAGTGERPSEITNAPIEGEGQLQVPYHPASESQSLDTLVPTNMQTAITDALNKLQARVGKVDDYVADRLGYAPGEIPSYFSAEQVDALGLALDNMERGSGFIIGDQTGIGKGRVVAGIIRYAIRSGRMPIFVTEKPGLYADMYRDMNDIGLPQMLGRPVDILMTNSAEKVPLDDDGVNVLKTPGAALHNAKLTSVAHGDRDGVDAVFTTYSQMQAVAGKSTPRQEALTALAPGSILIFDESHNAGGGASSERTSKKKDSNGVEIVAAPNRAQFARQLAAAAHGVFFSSATYAKRPEVMDLYGSTDMKLAVADISKLADAISKGGIPMQQVVATMLTKAGQYVRRERSFEGVDYRTPSIPVDRKAYAQFANVLNAIQKFQEHHVSDTIDNIGEDVKNDAASISHDGSVGGAGATSTNFTSVMHNLVEQMLVALKSGPAADMAIKALERGEKPVITLANTMGSFIKEYAEEHDLGQGGELPADFSTLLSRYLDRTRHYVIKKPFSPEKGEKHYISDEQLGPDGLAAYKAVQKQIAQMNLEGVPISPIDYIRNRLAEAGYKTGEITGRSHGVDYSGATPTLRIRPGSETSTTGKRAAISGFNNGDIDAMILNQSGSTGLSLHASSKFADQRPRNMIIAQAERNIDTHMQMLGRVHRTGQVVLPSYDQLVADVPAEMRPAAVLAKKMASLNANTTGARGSAMTGEDVPDFMNEYGDEIAARMMEDNPDLYRKLLSPIKESQGKNEGLDREDAARRVTGKLTLLPLEEQEAFYHEFLSEYHDYLAQKEAAGETSLEAKTLPLDAKPVESQQVIAPTDASSPFGAAVNREVMDVKRLGKPMQPAQVLEEISKNTGGETTQADPDKALAELTSAGKAHVAAMFKTAFNAFEDYKRSILDDLEPSKVKATEERLDENAQSFRQLMSTLYPGASVRLSNAAGESMYGVVMNLEKKGGAKNPMALGSYRATVALADAASRITLPLSQIRTPHMADNPLQRLVVPIDRINGAPVMKAFSEMQMEAREKRTFMTGNMLAAYEHTGGKGQIVNFVGHDGSIRSGIMMRRDYDYAKETASQPVPFRTPDQVMAWVGRGEKAFGDGVSVEMQNGRLLVTVAASKSAGGKYFLDPRVRAAVGGDFFKKSTGMVADAGMDKAREVISALQAAGATLTAKTNLDVARDIVGGEQPKNSILGAAEIAKQNIPEAGTTPLESAHPDLVARMQEAGLDGKVALEIADSLGGPAGQYHRGVITIAMDGPAAMDALNHEIIHAVRGAFTEPEWNVLTRTATSDPARMASVARRYPELDADGQAEEAVADMFSRFARGDQEPKGLLATAYAKLKAVFEAIGNALRGNGFQTADSVMRAVDSGDVSGRINEPLTAPERTLYSRAEDDELNAPRTGPGAIITRILGRGVDNVGHQLAEKARDVVPDPVQEIMHEIGMGINPMSEGSDRAQATAKDFANAQRLAAYQWGKVDEWLQKNFDPEQRRRMWEAADEHGVLLRKGIEPGEGQGLNRLSAKERETVIDLQRRADATFKAAQDLGMVTGEGLESYVPRMVVEMTAGGPRIVSKQSPRMAKKGANLSTTTGQLKQRKYETVEETEAAAKAKLGAGVEVVRDIRTLGLATQRLDQAVAGRLMVDRIKAMSKDAGVPLVTEGTTADPNAYFTMDHPALQTWGPKFTQDAETGKFVPVLDQNGEMQFGAHPLWISKEFEGPLKAVLTTPSSGLVRAALDLKAKMMSVIMYSPMMHNMVIFGKALPADPVGMLKLFEPYRLGNAARKDANLMNEAIAAGVVPVGHRYFMQDVAGIAAAEGQDMTPGRSWTAQLLAKIPGLFDPAAGVAVKRAVDQFGDFWHNTLLWDRIADLQMGLYVKIRDTGIRNGLDPQTAQREAAHLANRYAGALPMEALSKTASSAANLVLFSRSFTLGNLGAFKDLTTGLPSDVQAQIMRDSGPLMLEQAQGMMRRKAIGMFVLEAAMQTMGLAVAGYMASWVFHHAYQDKSQNEPGKQDRFLIRYAPDGTAIYGRLPTGKVFEDWKDWLTEPRKTFLQKQSPYGKCAYEVAANDTGFGHKLFDPNAKGLGGTAKNIGRIVAGCMGGMLPEAQFEAIDELAKGTAPDKRAAWMQAVAPITGITISHGYPGGPGLGEMNAAMDEQQFNQDQARPEITKMIKAGDLAGARQEMTSLGVAPYRQNSIIRVTINPGLRMNAKQLRDFMRVATPEEQARFQADRQQSSPENRGD